jgi:hypothetical protein
LLRRNKLRGFQPPILQQFCNEFAPPEFQAAAQSLVATIQHTHHTDSLTLGYAVYILRNITEKYSALTPAPSSIPGADTTYRTSGTAFQ